MIETGQSAPDFELPDQDGNPVRLSDLRGGLVVRAPKSQFASTHGSHCPCRSCRFASLSASPAAMACASAAAWVVS
jgi:peroxiredoxin